LTIRADDLPLLSEAAALAQEKYVTGASLRNWASYGKSVRLPDGLPDWRRHLLTDPQTSGGLLVACDADRAEDLRARIIAAGHPHASIIGHAAAGAPSIVIEA
jgi:selenide,water dikinase